MKHVRPCAELPREAQYYRRYHASYPQACFTGHLLFIVVLKLCVVFSALNCHAGQVTPPPHFGVLVSCLR
jgi:hypothetical protein